MSDLIYRQDAIKLFSERKNELGGIQGDLGGAMSGAVKLIESLPSAQQWTPVSEGLPKETGPYLGYISNSPYHYSMTCYYFANLKCWAPDDETASNNVVAWMELPEPYEEAVDDDNL